MSGNGWPGFGKVLLILQTLCFFQPPRDDDLPVHMDGLAALIGLLIQIGGTVHQQ